jgi:hypothetical protein
MKKPHARILDATAANRQIWKTKDDDRVIFIDIESELDVKPDIVMDCTNTDFLDNYFHTIIFDPPYYWGDKTGQAFYSIRNMNEYKKFSEKYNIHARDGRSRASYYGTDKYKTKKELLIFIHNAQEEFNRILMDNGTLWVKWNISRISKNEFVDLFKNWILMIQFNVQSPIQSLSETRTYWFMFMKKNQGMIQKTL